MPRDMVDPNLILLSKRARAIAPRLLDPLNSADEARQVQRRQELEEAGQRATEESSEVPNALHGATIMRATTGEVQPIPTIPSRKRGREENDSAQSGMRTFSLSLNLRFMSDCQLNGYVRPRSQSPGHQPRRSKMRSPPLLSLLHVRLKVLGMLRWRH